MNTHSAWIREITQDVELVNHLKTDYRKADLSPRDRAMLDFAAHMAKHHHDCTQDDIQRLRQAGFTDALILDMIYWIVAFNAANTLTDLTGLEVHENSPAVFVDEEDVPADYQGLEVHPGLRGHQEVLRPGWERAIVKPLGGVALEWINSRPLIWADVDGRVLVVTYWDVTHPNSLVGVPHWQRMHKTFPTDQVLVLGVHMAEFKAAKHPAIAQAEVERLGITYPVVLDPKFRKYAGANNRYWPATHVIDRQGYVRYRHYGPGGYDTVEAHVKTLLAEDSAGGGPEPNGSRGNLDQANPWLHPEATIELYTFRATSPRYGLMVGPDEATADLEPDRLYADGDWKMSENGRELAGGRGELQFTYQANQAGFFATPGPDGPAVFNVRLDGAPVAAGHAGADLNGQSQVIVDRPRFYWLAEHPGFESHRLWLEVATPGAGVHRFNFLPFRGVGEF